jgi:O-antigen/teichoic acid export membrane protein
VTAAEPARPTQSAPPLKQNVAWTLAGNIFYAGCQWGVFLALARLGSVEMVGQFALAFAVANPVFLFSQLQLRALQSTDASHAEHRPGDYVALRLVTTAIAMAVVSVVAISGGYRRETSLVILFSGAAKACEALSDVFYGHLQQHEEMAGIARSMMLRGLLSVTVVSVALVMTHNPVWGAMALAGAWALVLVFHDAPLARATGDVSTQLVWDISTMRGLAHKALPLGIVTMLASLDANIPRYFIAHLQGERALGIFAGLASLQAAGTVFVNAMGQSAAPKLARLHLVNDRKSFRALLTRLLLFALLPGVALVAVALIAGDAVPKLLFGPAFGGERRVFEWLALSAAIWLPTSILGYAATARRRIRFQPYALGAVAVTTLAASAFAVLRYGILGGAVSSAASAGMGCLLYAAGLFFPQPNTEAGGV